MSDIAIGVHGLRKHFGEVEALAGADFEVPQGTVFGLLGPNGAGKTTVIRVLSTILRPDEGSAEVLGYDVVREPEAVRRRIGLAGQYAAVDAEPHRSGEPRDGRRARPDAPAGDQAARGRAAGSVPARRRGRPDPEDVLGRHAPAPGHRGLADEQAAGAVPRRADDRSRHHQPQRAVGDDPRARERRHHGAAYHAVPGGGRHPREAHRRRRRWPRDRERHASGAEGAARQHGLRDGPAFRCRRARGWPAHARRGRQGRARGRTPAHHDRTRARARSSRSSGRSTRPASSRSRSPSASRAWTMCSSRSPAVTPRPPAARPSPRAEMPHECRDGGDDLGANTRPAHPAQRRPRHHGDREAQPAGLPARAAAARLLHDPARDLRHHVPVRLRRRDRSRPGRAVRRLPDARDLRADRRVRFDRDGDRPRHRHEERTDGAVPRAADGAFRRADRADLCGYDPATSSS